MSLEIGNSVKVKQGIKEPDSEDLEIGGWQGRVTGIRKKCDDIGNTMITIEWDSLTLKQLPDSFISQSENDGCDWKTMNLYESDLDKTVERDKNSEVKKVLDLLEEKYYWTSFGEEGQRISIILEGLNPSDEMECFQKWKSFLDTELLFPLMAIVKEPEDNWILKRGDKVQIKSLSEIVDLYGIIARLTSNSRSFEYPLCNLKVMDIKSLDYQLINDYSFWFTNRLVTENQIKTSYNSKASNSQVAKPKSKLNAWLKSFVTKK